MKIKIENTEQINAELTAINGRASAHTIDDAATISAAAITAEKYLEKIRLPKAMRKGARCIIHGGGSVARSYKYPRKTTRVQLDRAATGWIVTGITPMDLHPSESGGAQIMLTSAQKQEAVRRFSDGLIAY